MPVTKTPKAHIHVHWFLKDRSGKVEKEVKETYRYSLEMGPEEVTHELRKVHAFVEYEQHYAFYKDGATEYVRFEGTLLDTDLKLTADVFMCYCEPLNEDQEPPF